MTAHLEPPQGWAFAKVEDIAESVRYGTSSKCVLEPEGVPVLRMGNIVNGELDFENLKYLPEKHDNFPKFLLEPGDVLFNRTNSAELVGKTAVYKGYPEKCSYASYLIQVKTRGYDPNLLAAYINSPYGRRWASLNVSQQVGQANISGTKLKELELPVPPLNEQRRIVAKIEDLTVRSRNAKQALDALPPLLERFRQSVLAAAFRGDLTKQWRQQNPNTEPASELLKRIRQERRHRWEQDYLQTQKAKGKQPKNDKWKAKYQEPEPVDAADLPELPDGWCWSTTGELCDCIVPNRDKPKTFTGDIPWITIPDLSPNNIKLHNNVDGPGLTQAEVEQYRARVVPKNSVIMSCVGRFGIAAVITERVVINQQLHAFLPTPHLLSQYLAHAIQRQRGYLERQSTSTTIAYLNKTKCNSIPVPVAPLSEQKEIVSVLAEALATAEAQQIVADDVGQSMARLNQSILAKAFRGELVPQDPNDEPASGLLKRISANGTKK